MGVLRQHTANHQLLAGFAPGHQRRVDVDARSESALPSFVDTFADQSLKFRVHQIAERLSEPLVLAASEQRHDGVADGSGQRIAAEGGAEVSGGS